MSVLKAWANAPDLRVVPLAEYHPFPKWGEMNAFAGHEDWIRAGEKHLGRVWCALPATRFMDFQRNGNRSRFEQIASEERSALMALALAECAEGKGRFLDDVIDGVWAMCEQTSWCYPSAICQYPTVDCHDKALPDVEAYQYIELSSAYGAAQLALVYYLLKEPLDRESPLIARRIELELEKRIFDPFLGTDVMWWMALGTDRGVNNWCPWVSGNIMTCALMADPDPERREKVFRKTLLCCDRFLSDYPEDGGCDEGPSYFCAAGACLLDACEIATEAAQTDAPSPYSEKKLEAIASYLGHMHVVGPYYVNFADAPARLGGAPAGTLYRASEKLNLPELRAFALSLFERGGDRGGFPSAYPYRQMRDLLMGAPDEPCESVPEEASWYFGSIQVCVARSPHLAFAAKGGHNGETHNHNDVGSYVLYADGEPVIIDIGVGTYTRATFSNERWKIPAMRSDYHNTAIPGGHLQPPGARYRARNASFTDDGRTARFSLDLKEAYTAGVETFVRAFAFDRENESLTVSETYEGAPLELPILSKDKPILSETGADYGRIALRWDAGAFDARVEEYAFEDERFIQTWGQKSVWRLLLSRASGGAWKYAYQYKQGGDNL